VMPFGRSRGPGLGGSGRNAAGSPNGLFGWNV
jgi:hypothetical protein